MADILEWEHESIEYLCLYKDDCCRFSLEEFDGEAFIHCLVCKWSPQNYKNIKSKWKESITKDILAMGYTRVWAIVDTMKLAYFAHMMGFEYTDYYVENAEGTTGRLMIWA